MTINHAVKTEEVSRLAGSLASKIDEYNNSAANINDLAFKTDARTGTSDIHGGGLKEVSLHLEVPYKFKFIYVQASQ